MTGTVISHPLDPGIRIEIGDRLQVPAALDPHIERLWHREQSQRQVPLTNGQIYTLSDVQPDCLIIRPSEYRYVVAQRRDPGLKGKGLNIRPLAVTGILICADGLVLGRRGPHVTSDAGLWEPAPAGGLSIPDPEAQIIEELGEETGLSRSDIRKMWICGFVETEESAVFDIVFRLETDRTGQEVTALHARGASDEYDALAIIALPDVPAFLQSHRNTLLPALKPMLHMAGVPIDACG